jgi:hypothetical protein
MQWSSEERQGTRHVGLGVNLGLVRVEVERIRDELVRNLNWLLERLN